MKICDFGFARAIGKSKIVSLEIMEHCLIILLQLLLEKFTQTMLPHAGTEPLSY